MLSFIKMFIIVFLIVYLLYLFTVILNKKKINKILDTNQAKLVINFNKLNIELIDKKKFAHILSLANSFIVGFTFAVSEFFNNYFLKLFICFVLLFVLIFVVYKIVGLFFKKEGK